MNIRDLKYIVAVYEERSFSRAALKCFVSQPTLSMQIDKLEDELQVELFERSRGSFVVTKAGKEIVKKARQILFEIDEMKKIAKNFQDPFAADFKLGAFPTLSPYFFPKIVGKIHKKFSKLNLFLVEEKTENLIEKLQKGEIDAAFMASPLEVSDLDFIKIFEEEFLLAVPKNHKLAKSCKKIKQSDLKGQKLMLLEDGHCLRDQALEVCSMMGAFESQDFRASSLETLRQMVRIGAGITLIPEIAVKKDDKIAYLRIVGAPKREIGLFFRKSAVNEKIIKEISKISLI